MSDDPLSSMRALNVAITAADEAQCQELMRRERKGQRRLAFLLRIHGRYSRLRAQRERRELALSHGGAK